MTFSIAKLMMILGDDHNVCSTTPYAPWMFSPPST
jgi:hypothetical protein